VKEHTHEQQQHGMESPTGVRDPPPKESFERVRPKMNTAFRGDLSNLVASPKFCRLWQTAKLQSLADMDGAFRTIVRDKFGKVAAQILEQDIRNVIAEFREQILKVRPQPIEYGLTYDDLHLYDHINWHCPLDDGKVIRCLGTRADDKYKEGKRWFNVLLGCRADASKAAALAFWLLLFGSLAIVGAPPIGIVLLAVGLGILLFAIAPGIVIKNKRRRASAGLKAYWQALQLYDQHKAAAEAAVRQAARDAEVRQRQAARDAELRKRSYWEFLDGYAFERATAEVLKRHQFNPRVTPGSADGGIDIEVTRNGFKGVVQCKAHVACVGPHVVRDLYGVIHHCGAEFGIIVSRGGFSRGAIDFAEDKPIFFLDISDLIAMQEGLDVLAAAFSSSPATAS